MNVLWLAFALGCNLQVVEDRDTGGDGTRDEAPVSRKPEGTEPLDSDTDSESRALSRRAPARSRHKTSRRGRPP